MFLELGLPEIRNWAMHYDLKRGKKYNFRNPKILTFFSVEKNCIFHSFKLFFFGAKMDFLPFLKYVA